GVGGVEQVGPGGQDVGRLAVAELGGRLGVEDVVDPRRAAADLRVRDLDEAHPGDAAQEVARRAHDLLGVPQVAGGVIGDYDLPGGVGPGRGGPHRVPRGDRPEVDEDLGEVAHLLAEGSRPVGVVGVVGEEVDV